MYLGMSTDDYIRLLQDLESGLYKEQLVTHYYIKKEPNQILSIFVRLRKISDHPNIKTLIEKAKLLAKMAVDIQNFNGAKIDIITDFNEPVLQEIVIS